MVLIKKFNYGFNGFDVPVIPKGPRSRRQKKFSRKKIVDDSKICAFELLASLAGKLLQENESSSDCSNDAPVGTNTDYIAAHKHKHKQKDEDQLNSSTEKSAPSYLLKENGFLQPSAVYSCLDGADGDLNSWGPDNKKECGGSYPCKLEGDSTRESSGGAVNNRIENWKKADKFRKLMNSGRDIRSASGCVPEASFPSYRNVNKLVPRDDDENRFRCNKLSKLFKGYQPPLRMKDRRTKKFSPSKYWNTVPKLKDVESATPHSRCLFSKRKTWYQLASIQKRRKCSNRISVLTSDGRFSSESISNFTEKDVKKASGVSSSVLRDEGAHVKFNIKSFKVPELFVEVPKTATVGSLKRTIMEAVTTLLGDGLRVGVLVHGKKVKDEGRTLLQTGISCNDNHETLGFTLESSLAQSLPFVCAKDSPTTLSKSSEVSRAFDCGSSSILSNSPLLSDSINHIGANSQLVPYIPEMVTNKKISDSRALVPVTAVNVNALDISPLNQKPRRSEFASRRTRRPFSVLEVEALVQAVEELGTGRWRDVKLLSFENADHRTYVDLKDKWKTLVHTAGISPQQRRGEPVPQELLDRVLASHAYWSHYHAKQHKALNSTSKNQILHL